MKRKFVLFKMVMAFALSGTLGCTSGIAPSPSPAATASRPSVSGNPTTETPWSLSFVHHCKDLQGKDLPQEDCVGAFGFTVDSGGAYRLGPGPSDEVLSGMLTAQELGELKQEFAHPAWSTQGCARGHGKDDDEEEEYLLQLDSSPICGDSKSLRDRLSRLATRYSPSKFPNPCIDASMSLDTAYKAMRHCEQDSDCVFVGDDFLPVRDDAHGEIESDDCSYLHPMLAGNSFLLVSNQLELLMKRDLARKVCGDDLMRSSCKEHQSIDTRWEMPVCVDEVCQMGRLK